MSTFNELIDFTRSTTGTYLDSVVYGDELVTNGTFATDSDWVKGTGWSISGGVGVANGVTSQNLRQNGVALEGNKVYSVTVYYSVYKSRFCSWSIWWNSYCRQCGFYMPQVLILFFYKLIQLTLALC